MSSRCGSGKKRVCKKHNITVNIKNGKLFGEAVQGLPSDTSLAIAFHDRGDLLVFHECAKGINGPMICLDIFKI